MVSSAGSSVSPHLFCLRWCGFCRLPPAAEPPPAPATKRYLPTRRALHDAYRTLALVVTSVYMVQECIYAYQERRDMDKLSRVMFLLLCHVTSIAKQIVFYVDADKIDRLIGGLDAEVYNEESAGGCAATLRRETAESAARLERAYAGCAVLTCTLWLVFPVLDYLRGGRVEFALAVGLPYDTPFMFVLVLLYTYYVTTLVGIANTTMDAFMATILYQCKTQLRILRLNFERVVEEAQALAARTGDSYEAALRSVFLHCLLHYRKIRETCDLLQEIFGMAILVQFGIGGWILCMAAYKLVSLSVLSIEFASMTLFICCILTELFLYCYYGNEVTVESERMVQSLYSMSWTRTPSAFRRSLVLAMERAKRPLRPAAGLVVPLSLDTFVTILKSSYTFYAVLRQTK